MSTIDPDPKVGPMQSVRGCSGVRVPHHQAEGITDHAACEQAAAAMLPEDLIQPNEIIVLLLKPSAWFVVLASLRSLAWLGLLTLVAVGAQSYYSIGLARREIILVGASLIGLRLLWQFLEWLSHVYLLTDQRLVRVKGVVRVHVFETQLSRIQHTELYLSLRERLFGLGTIAFATSGTALPEAAWVMVSQPLEVHQKVIQTLNRYRS